jgi:hypothetical protein
VIVVNETKKKERKKYPNYICARTVGKRENQIMKYHRYSQCAEVSQSSIQINMYTHIYRHTDWHREIDEHIIVPEVESQVLELSLPSPEGANFSKPTFPTVFQSSWIFISTNNNNVYMHKKVDRNYQSVSWHHLIQKMENKEISNKQTQTHTQRAHIYMHILYIYLMHGGYSEEGSQMHEVKAGNRGRWRWRCTVMMLIVMSRVRGLRGARYHKWCISLHIRKSDYMMALIAALFEVSGKGFFISLLDAGKRRTAHDHKLKGWPCRGDIF